MKRAVSLVILVIFSLQLKAEEIPFGSRYNARLMMQRPLPRGDFNKLVLPVKRVGNLIIVEATVDGIRGNFIFDTGAPYLVLNETYFREYEEVPDVAATDVNGNLVPQKVTKVSRLKMLGMHYENVEADVSDLSAIENRRGIKILGLLGVNLFMRMEIELDLRNEQLIIYRVDREGRRLDKPYEHQVGEFSMPFDLSNNAILIDGKINGKDLRFCMDSGAEVLMLANNLPAEVYEDVRIVRRSTLLGSSSEAEVLVGALRKLDVGLALTNCQVIIADLEEIGRAYGTNVDGFVGYDLLKEGRLCINFKTKELIVNAYSD